MPANLVSMKKGSLSRFPELLVMALTLGATGSAFAKLTLVEDGQPVAVVVTADTPEPVVADAVRELNHWVSRISGAPLPVLTETEWRAAGERRPYLAIGPSGLAGESARRASALKPEGALVQIGSDHATLVGNDDAPPGREWRGTYYAVRELVEKRLHVRNLWPGEEGTTHPRQPTLVLEEEEWTWEPPMLLSRWIRSGYGENLRETMEGMLGLPIDREAWTALREANEEWLKRQRLNIPSRVQFGHSFTSWWERFSQSHPEWFAKPPTGVSQAGGKGVKLNLTDPGVLKQVIADWEPGRAPFLSVCPNDSRGFCTRPESRAWDAPAMAALSDGEIWSSDRAELTDRHVHFANLVSDAAAAIAPGTTVTTYAYRNYRKPPLTERVKGNLLVAYVGGEGYYPDERFIVEEWKGWAEKGARLFWRPNLFCGGHGVPFIFARQLREDFATFLEHGMEGTNIDGGTIHWATQGLNYYVTAQMHFRPEESYETFLAEYTAAYGPAAEAVEAYLAYSEKNAWRAVALLREKKLVPRETWGGWWQGYIRLVPLLMSPEVVAEGERHLAAAEAAAAGGEPIHQERVAFLRRGFEHSRLMAEVLAKVDFQQPGATPKEVLAPLWEARRAALLDFAIPSARLFLEEQRQFGLWDSYLPRVSKGRGQRLSTGWTLRVDPRNEGEKAGWPAAREAGAGWELASVGVPWAETTAGKGAKFPTTRKTVWYRRELELPELDDTSQRLALRFGSVDAEVKIWINGELLLERNYPHAGDYDSWKKPFEVDLSALAVGARKGWLVVKVTSDRPNGGITGPVELVAD